MQSLKGARHGGQEYFWINDMTPRRVTHPFKPELDGKDVGAIKDPTGNALLQRFAETVRERRAGFVSYQWPRPGFEQPVEKLC